MGREDTFRTTHPRAADTYAFPDTWSASQQIIWWATKQTLANENYCILPNHNVTKLEINNKK